MALIIPVDAKKVIPEPTLTIVPVSVTKLSVSCPFPSSHFVIVPPVRFPEFLSSTLSEFIVMPVPTPTVNVLSAFNSPPPVRPFPAITDRVRLDAVDAIPVRLPTNPFDAVTTPEALIFLITAKSFSVN